MSDPSPVTPGHFLDKSLPIFEHLGKLGAIEVLAEFLSEAFCVCAPRANQLWCRSFQLGFERLDLLLKLTLRRGCLNDCAHDQAHEDEADADDAENQEPRITTSHEGKPD